MTNTTPPTQQFHLTACRVGDWVLASAVPGWKTDRVKQTFTPPNQVLAGMFGAPIQAPREWIFHGGYYIQEPCSAVAVWRRES